MRSRLQCAVIEAALEPGSKSGRGSGYSSTLTDADDFARWRERNAEKANRDASRREPS